MEPRDRRRNPPPRRPARRRAVEDHRLGDAGGIVVRRALRRAGPIRACAALSPALGVTRRRTVEAALGPIAQPFPHEHIFLARPCGGRYVGYREIWRIVPRSGP